MHEYHVTMVFGVYAVDNDSEVSKQMRKYIGAFVRAKEHVRSFHALYIREESKRIYVDFIVDYEQDDWDSLKEEFEGYMNARYPEYSLELTIETEFV